MPENNLIAAGVNEGAASIWKKIYDPKTSTPETTVATTTQSDKPSSPFSKVSDFFSKASPGAINALGASLVAIGQHDFKGASQAFTSYQQAKAAKKAADKKSEAAAAARGDEFSGTNYRGNDGKNYKFVNKGPNSGKYLDPEGNIKPSSVNVRPVSSEKVDSQAATTAYEKGEGAVEGLRKIDGIADEIQRVGGSEGVVGSITEYVNGILGTQGSVSVWKVKFKGFITSEVVNNLPPGVASDKDIELVRSAFPDENWDKKALLEWMSAYRKQLMYAEAYYTAKGEYITSTGSQSGFSEEWLNSDQLEQLKKETINFSYGGSLSSTAGGSTAGGSTGTNTTSTGVTWSIVE